MPEIPIKKIAKKKITLDFPLGYFFSVLITWKYEIFNISYSKQRELHKLTTFTHVTAFLNAMRYLAFN